MYIAQQKRKENIAEYILYLWQLEDLLRALKFSPDAIYRTLVEQSGRDEMQKQSLFLWYVELGDLLKSEGKAESGHLEHTLHLIKELEALHEVLMKVPAGAEYRRLFLPLSEELPRLRIVLARDGVSDMELCFRALYAVMLYRIKGDESKKEVNEDVVAMISPVIGKLAEIYHLIEMGKFDIDRQD